MTRQLFLLSCPSCKLSGGQLDRILEKVTEAREQLAHIKADFFPISEKKLDFLLATEYNMTIKSN